MTLRPVLAPWLLVAVAALVIAARIVALRQWQVSGRNREALWRWIGVTSAALLLLAAAARPVLVHGDQLATRTAGAAEPNVFLVVDRSPDMAARDLDNRTRMDAARDDITALIERYPHARFAVIGFASAPSMDWPLSADTWSLRPVMDALTPYAFGTDTVAQTNAGAANTVLRYQLISAPSSIRGPGIWCSISAPELANRRCRRGNSIHGPGLSTAVRCWAMAPQRAGPSQALTSKDPPSTTPSCGRSPASLACPTFPALIPRH